MSSTKQLGTAGRLVCIKSVADSKSRTCRPTDRGRALIAPRTIGSSSTIKTIQSSEGSPRFGVGTQVVTRHAPDEIIYPQEGYLGLNYTRDLIIIQITWVSGRSVDVKKKFFRRIADEIHEKAHVRKEDIWINLVDTNREDWSFGDGEMQYAPK
jgi:phenylpyruvate tautomerase PptA (4-oxalocrotonate tautomerase family)